MINQDYWYYYFWNFINFPKESTIESDWQVLIRRNNQIVDSLDFQVWRHTGIHQVEENQLIYHNTLDKSLHLKMKPVDKSQLSIYNLSGQLVSTFNLDQHTEKIHIAHLPKGAYISVISNETRTIAKKKIIVQ
jgi:hypothetical protein